MARRGWHLSRAARARITAAERGRKRKPLSAAARKRISSRLRGKHHKVSAAERARLAKKLKGRKVSSATRRKISSSLRGRHHRVTGHHVKRVAGVSKKAHRSARVTVKHHTGTTRRKTGVHSTSRVYRSRLRGSHRTTHRVTVRHMRTSRGRSNRYIRATRHTVRLSRRRR